MKRHRMLRAACWTVIVSLAGSSPLLAEGDVRIVKIEEDWELKVLTPDSNSSGPQIICVLSPCEGVDCDYATFEINHRSVPHYIAGGLHLQTWEGTEVVSTKTAPHTELMTKPGETVKWTQRMEVTNGVLSFSIVDGTSSTWGAFGGQGYLKTHVSTGLSNLNGYNPAVSAAHSGVGYAANRVQHLILRRVRLTTNQGQVIEYNNPTTVYPEE